MNRSSLIVGMLALAGCGSASAGLTASTAASMTSTSTTAAATTAASASPLPATTDADAVQLPTLAVISASGSITVVRGGAVSATYAHARLAVDGHTLVHSVAAAGRTTVEWTDIADGTPAGSVTIDGTFELAALDEAADTAAVVSPPGDPTGDDIAGGRASTELAVVRRPAVPGQSGTLLHRDVLAGNVEPEMISSSAVGAPLSVFLLEYLPAAHPEVYRVRVLDTATGTMTIPLDLREKTEAADEAMAGISRSQVTVADRKLLLTLYRGRNPDGTLYAFVHALRYDTTDAPGWPGTYCLDLPDSLQLQSSPGAAATSTDQKTMFIANGRGTIASLRVSDLDDRSSPPGLHATSQLDVSADHAPAITATDDSVWVGYGNVVAELDPTTLTARRRFTVPDDILAMTATATNLITVNESAITITDLTGSVVGRLPLDVAHPIKVAVASSRDRGPVDGT